MTANGDSTPCKICTRCKVSKPLGEFRKKLDKLTSACAACLSAADKAYWANRSAEKVEKQNARRLEWVKKNPEAKARGNAAYLARNPQRVKESQRKWYEKNVEYFREKSKRWALENPEQYREMMRRAEAKMLAQNPVFAMKKRCRALVGASLRSGGFVKRSATAQILGCSWREFAAHIEKQFLKGMTWENRHAWHLDHIVPLATASTAEDVIRLNHFTNLRPFWAEDNLSKGAQITHLI